MDFESLGIIPRALQVGFRQSFEETTAYHPSDLIDVFWSGAPGICQEYARPCTTEGIICDEAQSFVGDKGD